MGGMKVGERANAELTGDTLEEARSLLELLRAERVIDTQTYRRWLDQISCAVVRRGHYRMESSELEHACRVAWRQSSRCIGRLLWKTLIVRDCRELVTPEEIFGACVDHLRLATNGGRIRPVMSIFAADRDQLHAMTTLVLGSWVRASCQPGSVRGGPDRSPGGCGARCTKHHAGTHRVRSSQRAKTPTPGAGNNVTFIKGVSLMPTPTNAAPNGGATDAVAGDILARSTRALTSIVQSAVGKARELSDGVAAEFKKVAGLPAVDAHHRPGLHLGDPTAWV